VTPNGDGVHDFLKIENITDYPENTVVIYNRWGDKVFEATGYDNLSVVFNGNANIGSEGELDTGNFYYSIDKGNGDKVLTGFLFLKR
jgi:gliding motility-associated-like protein